ncbi:hypothetical protein B0H12DRAFT_272862 [Mycena haematopus]|nr:hypothetical protein B0H12DRAFT_272862 [Mycena haematopus]
MGADERSGIGDGAHCTVTVVARRACRLSALWTLMRAGRSKDEREDEERREAEDEDEDESVAVGCTAVPVKRHTTSRSPLPSPVLCSRTAPVLEGYRGGEKMGWAEARLDGCSSLLLFCARSGTGDCTISGAGRDDSSAKSAVHATRKSTALLCAQSWSLVAIARLSCALATAADGERSTPTLSHRPSSVGRCRPLEGEGEGGRRMDDIEVLLAGDDVLQINPS